jgi:hypothetical protein
LSEDLKPLGGDVYELISRLTAPPRGAVTNKAGMKTNTMTGIILDAIDILPTTSHKLNKKTHKRKGFSSFHELQNPG